MSLTKEMWEMMKEWENRHQFPKPISYVPPELPRTNQTKVFDPQKEIGDLKERVSKLEEWIKNHGKGY